jgi:hypothetical protein
VKRRLWKRYGRGKSSSESDAWVRREAEIRKEVEETFKSIDERVQWVVKRENDLAAEETGLNDLRSTRRARREDETDRPRRHERFVLLFLP